MQFKKHAGTAVRYLPALLVFGLLFVRNAAIARFSGNFNMYMTLCFGGPPATGQIDITTTFFWNVSVIVLLFCLSGIMKQDLLANYVYVFTRLGKKGGWLRRKTLLILFHSFFIYLVLFLCAAVVGRLFGLAARPSDAYALLVMYLLNAVSVFIISFIQNFLSLRHGQAQAYLIVIACYLASVLAALVLFNANGLTNAVLILLIPTNQMYLWHTGCVPAGSSACDFGRSLNGFSFLYTTIVFVVYTAAAYWAANTAFEKLDLSDIIRED